MGQSRKADVLRLCRNVFPDHALAWLDATVALGGDGDPTFSRLLGTGGNFGRQDLSSTYLQRALAVLSDRRSRAWLAATLSGDESVPYLRDAVGQFDPSRAGGIQSSPWEKADDKGFVNPWSFLLTVEGALLFAGAVVRRLGAQFGRPSLPFQVRGSTAGFASGAAAETALGEIWVPEWSAPAGLTQVEHLLTEGRAEWRDRPAASGLDFARAVSTLGVDRGLDAFTRHVFVDRLGQSPLAVPGGRIEVTSRHGPALLGDLDPWMARLRGDLLPNAITAGLRSVEQRLFDLAAGRGGLVEVFTALGRLSESVVRSGGARTANYPLELGKGDDLLDALVPILTDDLELRLALAFATLSDPGAPKDGPTTIRAMTHPIEWTGQHWAWARKAAVAPLSADVGRALAETSRRRSFPGVVPERVTDRAPAVRGTRIVFERGFVLDMSDRHRLLRGAFDRARFTDLLTGLICVTWPDRFPRSPRGSAEPHVPAVDVLAPFCDAHADPVLVRPGSGWPVQLASGRLPEVLGDAAHRIRLAGSRFVVEPIGGDLDPDLVAASLLLPTTRGQRAAALDRVRIADKETA